WRRRRSARASHGSAGTRSARSATRSSASCGWTAEVGQVRHGSGRVVAGHRSAPGDPTMTLARRRSDWALFARLLSETRPYGLHLIGLFAIGLLAAPLSARPPPPRTAP